LLGLDLEEHPESAAKPEVGFRIAAAFWKSHGLNELADKQEFKEITHRINGGYNGLKERVNYYNKAKAALSMSTEITDSGDDFVSR
jgi:putative chitinase